MTNIDNKTVIDWIKNKEFSNLAFLDNYWRSHENEWYIGFYYFIQHLKRESLDDVIAEVVSRQGDESSAYCYLGKTASKIYDSFYEYHIPAGYYRKAVELNPHNADAHWGLFQTDGATDSCIKSLSSDYESGQLERLEHKIRNLSYRVRKLAEFSHQDWHAIKTFVQDDRITCKKEMLVFAHFYLDEVEDTLSLIKTMDKVNIEIIKAYFDRELITKEFALTKLYYSSVHELLGEDHKSIYQAHASEAKKGKPNPTRTVLMQKAFRAKEYKDVVTYYEEAPEGDIMLRHEVSPRLYYLLALSYLNQSPNKQALELVNSKASTLRDESLALYNAVRCKHNIEKLEQIFFEGKDFDHPISVMGLYQDANSALDNPSLINHYLHEPLSKELDSLKNKWNHAYHHQQLTEMKAKLANGDMNSEDYQRLHNLGMECNEFDFVIESVTEFHKSNAPTMSSYNCIGVCHDFKEEFSIALEYYKLALDLMVLSKNYSHTIISNYLSCAKKVPDVAIPENEFHTLRNQFNVELTNRFKWGIFTAKKGTLFKYSPFNINTIDALTNQYLYLASKEQLNDPIELPALSKLDSDSLVDPTNYRICSLSNNQNSMLMWSHYAQEHQGIMVGYWFGGEFPSGVGVAKVDYADHLKRNREQDLYVFNQYLLTKNKEWEYEHEVRIFSNQKETVSFDIYEYPNNDRDKINAHICSITLGCKFPENKKQLIANIVNSMNSQRKNHEPKVTLREAFIPEDNSFALEYRDIDIANI
ncbi:DUF2971 domain-containing protein [Vibrio alginolyticus]|uniref:DUF2971 domain-containing protein n=1 Tax=Vibrio alginolyticus TaxID=663 RepID=UPI001BD2C997|nr:DUF2971 domain-containing protein [Vibrio alginolyticus]MBT0074536.1 DUF2971 domain-containing protein [Vibrio alginolyticus]